MARNAAPPKAKPKPKPAAKPAPKAAPQRNLGLGTLRGAANGAERKRRTDRALNDMIGE